jgi:hypothetical protein
MGTLTPGATYIYESPDGGETVYAREIGSQERRLIGKSYKAVLKEELNSEVEIFKKMFVAAKDDPALKDAIERAKMLYYLSKKDE